MNREGPLLNPRLLGIREQYARARRFVKVAQRCKKPASHFRNLIAAIYPARAIVELMLEALDNKELPSFKNKDPRKNREEFENLIAPKLPHYYLIEKIRIHDFHRFGCLPPQPSERVLFYGGPIKLIARKGAAILQGTSEGPKITTTGSSTVKEQRPLYSNDGRFFDEQSGTYLPLAVILGEFLDLVPDVIVEFEVLLAS